MWSQFRVDRIFSDLASVQVVFFGYQRPKTEVGFAVPVYPFCDSLGHFLPPKTQKSISTTRFSSHFCPSKSQNGSFSGSVVRSLCLSERQFPTPRTKATAKDLADLGAGDCP